jgi:hypothetical protein
MQAYKTSEKEALDAEDASGCSAFLARESCLLLVFQRFITTTHDDEWLLHVVTSAVLRAVIVFEDGSSVIKERGSVQQK